MTIENGYATYTVPGGTVSGLFKLPAGYFTKEVNVLMGDNSTVTRLQQGAYTDQDVYYCDDKGFVTVTSEVTSPTFPHCRQVSCRPSMWEIITSSPMEMATT